MTLGRAKGGSIGGHGDCACCSQSFSGLPRPIARAASRRSFGLSLVSHLARHPAAACPRSQRRFCRWPAAAHAARTAAQARYARAGLTTVTSVGQSQFLPAQISILATAEQIICFKPPRMSVPNALNIAACRREYRARAAQFSISAQFSHGRELM